MDFITCLPKTAKGHDAIMTFVDKLTKMVHLVPCALTIDSKGAAEAYRDFVVKYHGLAKKIITDRDGRFTGNFMDALAEAMHVKQALSTSFHPQTDGQTEIMNQIVEDTIRHYVSPDQKDWDEWLTPVEFAINNAYQESIRSTPFRLNYGRDPHMPQLVDVPTRAPHPKRWLECNRHMVERARYFIKAAQDRQQTYANQRRSPVEFRLHQWVWLSSKNMKFKVGGTKKMLPKYIGPFKIIQLIGGSADRPPPAVKLELPRTCRIHPVFHVSLLKEYHPRPGVVPRTPPISVDQDGVPIFEVDRIVGEKVMTVHGQRHRCFLLRWKGYSELDDTWEKEANILGPSLIRDWRRTHPGPAPTGRALVADVAPVTAHRPLTRTEKRRLAALSDTQHLMPVTYEQLCSVSRPLRILARQHPTLAALVFWEQQLPPGSP